MANPNPKQENLVSFTSKWQSGKTKLYRLPESIAPQVLELAHKIDQGQSISVTSDKSTEIAAEFNEAIATLEAALKLRANAGGAIKTEIKKALGLLCSITGTSDRRRSRCKKRTRARIFLVSLGQVI